MVQWTHENTNEKLKAKRSSTIDEVGVYFFVFFGEGNFVLKKVFFFFCC